MSDSQRIVSRFSCGAASAVATKLAVEKYGDDVRIINAFIAEEDDDNRRFLADCERWFGQPVLVLRDEKYGASITKCWEKNRFIVSQQGAPCTRALKREVLDRYRQPDDLMVLGFTAEETTRRDEFVDANADVQLWTPLIDAGLTHRDCLERVHTAGIELPRMYRLGYHNANCPMCPKGGMGYWNKIRVDFPENFEKVARLQDLLGPGSYFFRERKTGERISLRMLAPDRGRWEDEPPISCGATCEWNQLDLLERIGA